MILDVDCLTYVSFPYYVCLKGRKLIKKCEAMEYSTPILGRHETFPFRHGWLKKGLDALTANPEIFSLPDALVVLGVGKNMVRSIRHWCLATGLSEPQADRRSASFVVTHLGKRLIQDGGWDPYLEDTGTLWLLHWQIVSNLRRGLAWNLLFTAYPEPEFSRAGLFRFLKRQLERQGIHSSDRVVQREMECCLRTYLPAQKKEKDKLRAIETSVNCPLLDLKLLRPLPSEDMLRFSVGAKPSLPTQVVGFALLHFWRRNAAYRKTITVDECIYHRGSPGQAFKLDENSMTEYLIDLQLTVGRTIQIQETSGLRQIYLNISPQDVEALSFELLETYYG